MYIQCIMYIVYAVKYEHTVSKTLIRLLIRELQKSLQKLDEKFIYVFITLGQVSITLRYIFDYPRFFLLVLVNLRYIIVTCITKVLVCRYSEVCFDK